MDTLYLLALLACPVGMGVMMWFMMRGQHGNETRSQSTDQDHEVAQLRSEVDELRRRNNHQADPH